MKIKQLPVTLNVVDFGAVQGWWGRLLLALGGFMSVKVAPVQRSTDVTFHFSLIMTYWLRGGQPASLTKYYFPQWGSALTQTAVPWKEERDGVWRHFPFFQKAHYFNGTGKKKNVSVSHSRFSPGQLIGCHQSGKCSRPFQEFHYPLFHLLQLPVHQALQFAHHPHTEPQTTLLCWIMLSDRLHVLSNCRVLLAALFAAGNWQSSINASTRKQRAANEISPRCLTVISTAQTHWACQIYSETWCLSLLVIHIFVSLFAQIIYSLNNFGNRS